MSGRQLISRAQHQIIDFGVSGPVSVPAATSTSIQAQGTLWPILPNTSLRVYHVSANLNPDAAGAIALNDFSIQLALEDNAGSGLGPALFLASGNYPSDTIIGPDASAIGASGDPILQLAAGSLIVNETRTATALQFFAIADVTNTDAVNPHNVSLFFGALIAFLQLS